MLKKVVLNHFKVIITAKDFLKSEKKVAVFLLCIFVDLPVGATLLGDL